MPPPRLQSLPAANKIFVNREQPLRVFEDAAFDIGPDRAGLLVFHGIGGQGKTALCREIWARTGSDPSYGFLRRAELDLHGRPKTDPDLLLVWIRNGFAASGVILPCFDVAFAIAWEASRAEQPLPRMDRGWLARHREEISGTFTDLAQAFKESLGEAATGMPVLGALIRSLGGLAIRKGYEKYLHQSRDALSQLYRDGQLKKPYELSALLPWMLAQDLNHHLASNPTDRFVLLIDEYERVFDEGGAGARWKENPFDRHVRQLVQETNGLLVVFFTRERLPWADDPDWRDELEGSQHLLGGLADEDADRFLRAIPIDDDEIRAGMIEGARETPAADAPVYALMLDLQVEHWRSLVALDTPIEPQAFRMASADFEGRRRELVDRVLRDYGQPLQTTLGYLANARRFDRAAFEHVIRTFHTGLALEAFETIAAMSFVTEDEDGYLSIHGVVVEAIRELLDKTTRQAALEALFDHYAARAVVATPREVTDATIAALFEASYCLLTRSPSDYLDWFPEVASPLVTAARYRDATLLWHQALVTSERIRGRKHPSTATSLNNLAYLLHSQGDLAGAKPLYERGLAIREKALGPEHPDTATSLNNLACLLQAQGDLGAAKPLFERALANRENALGPEHPHTATSLNNLADLLQAQGDLAGAEPLFERALANREKALGAKHPDTATSLNNLAGLLHAQGNLAGAKPLYERALAIHEKALGPEHPDTAMSLNNLAGLLQAQGDLAGAKPLYERALAINEKALGPQHPRTATSLNNLAYLLQAQGDLAGAKPLYERALAIREKALGREHPDTATSLNNLAGLLEAQGDLAGAKPLFESALAIHEKALGPEHPDTAMSLNNLAGLLQAQGDLAGAKPLYERALAINEKALGPQHPRTATSLNNLAYLLQAQGDLAGAKPLFERALAIYEKALGPEHPDTATSLNNLADLLQVQGDLARAKPFYERALAIREKALGPEHPDTAKTLNSLACLLQAQGDLAGAKSLCTRALAISEKVLGSQHPTTVTMRVNLGRLDT